MDNLKSSDTDKRRSWAPEMFKRAVALVKEGYTHEEVGKVIGRCKSSVQRHLTSAGFNSPIRRDTWRPEEEAIAKDCIARGLSDKRTLAELEKHGFKRSYYSIVSFRRRRNIIKRRTAPGMYKKVRKSTLKSTYESEYGPDFKAMNDKFCAAMRASPEWQRRVIHVDGAVVDLTAHCAIETDAQAAT